MVMTTTKGKLFKYENNSDVVRVPKPDEKVCQKEVRVVVKTTDLVAKLRID
jgi:hypothetical protein